MPTPHRILLVFTEERWFIRDTLHGLFDYRRERSNWQIVWRDHDALGELGMYDGVIGYLRDPPHIEACVAAGVPAVTFSAANACGGVSRAIADHRVMGALAADHALSAGYPSFACARSPEPLRGPRLRFDGWRKRLRTRLGTAAGDVRLHTYAGEDAALRQWLQALPHPVAVLCDHDATGLRVLDACHDARLAVPEQIGVIGMHNNELLCESARPTLTSLDPGFYDIGWAGGLELDRRLSDEAQRDCWRVRRVRPRGVFVRQSTGPRVSDDLLVARAAGYVRDHVSEPMTASVLAEALGVSRRLLEMRMRAALNQSPHDMIREARLHEARRLLTQTDLPLARVAAASGFSNAAYFSTHFRREAGVPPSQFRRDTRRGQ
ncbi:MAG: helix-turn-helix domain-containing protein [Phycisphaeraceae bacterium]